MARISIKAYLAQAVWQWCEDVGDTPYILVAVNDSCVVPQAFVEDGQIVLDISSEATSGLDFSDTELTFDARFGERAMTCRIPYTCMMAIFPQEEPEKGIGLPVHMNEQVPQEQTSEPDCDSGAPIFSRVK